MATKFTNGADLQGQRIVNVGSPSAGTDAPNKDYVDTVARGLDWKASVRAATTANGALATAFENGDVIDGVTLATGDRILLKNQTTQSENGIYTVNATGAPTRAVDADSSAEVTAGLATSVSEGTVNGNTVWYLTTDDPVVLGTSLLVFSQLGGAGSVYIAGGGLTESPAGTFNVGAGNGITVAADAVAVDPSIVTRKFAANIGDGSTTQIIVTHNLNTEDVQVKVRYAAGTKEYVIVDARTTGVNTVRIDFATAPASGEFRAIVMG